MPTDLVITMNVQNANLQHQLDIAIKIRLSPVKLLRTTLANLLNLHRPVFNPYFAIKKFDACEECLAPYPCRTIEYIKEVLN